MMPGAALRGELVRYYSVSALALALDLSLFAAFISSGVSALVASIISYAAAGVVHFLLTRGWTFNAAGDKAVRQMILYITVVGMGWISTAAVVAFTGGTLHFQPFLSKFTAVAATLPIGFLGHKYVTFRKRVASVPRPALGAAAVFIAGLFIAIVPAFFLLQRSGPCLDLTNAHGLVARTSQGLLLPLPIVFSCKNVAPVFGAFATGYAIAGIGAVLLIRTAASSRLIAATAALALCMMLVVPFVPNADPYSYALAAYIPFVLRQSPYVPHSLGVLPAQVQTLAWLLPGEHNPLRTSNYGPVFIGLYALLVGPFGYVSLRAMLLAERIVGALLLLLFGSILSRQQTDAISRRRVFVAIVLNPLLLFETVAFAHGDIVMMLLLLCALLLYRRNAVAACASVCVLAVDTRSVAAVAFLVLIAELLHRKRYSQACEAAVSAALTAFAVWFCAQRLLGGAGHVGGFFYADANSLGTALTWLISGTAHNAVVIGFLVNVALGAALLYAGLRERLYRLALVAVYAALPGIEPWYLQWISPFAATAQSIPWRNALIAAMALAPCSMYLEMTQLSVAAPAAHALIVALLWFVPVSVYLLTKAAGAVPGQMGAHAA